MLPICAFLDCSTRCAAAQGAGDCPVPEIANVLGRCRVPFFQVTGMLNDDPCAWGEIRDWVAPAKTAHVMEHNRLGLMGHYYGGMLDIYSDLTQQCASFGGHMEFSEIGELAALRQRVEKHALGSLAYYHQGAGSAENEDVISSVILGMSLLTGRRIPVAGEYEVKNVQAMKIMDSFGAGGSFSEYYAPDSEKMWC